MMVKMTFLTGGEILYIWMDIIDNRINKRKIEFSDDDMSYVVILTVLGKPFSNSSGAIPEGEDELNEQINIFS